MGDVIFEDFSIQVKNAIDDRINIALEEAAGELESAVKRNTSVGKVNGSGTKNSWRHKVVDSENTVYIGNDKETAIWLEYGTGEYAITENGGRGGRKGGWLILIGNGEKQISPAVVKAYGFKTREGKDGKKFAFTKGMKPQRPFWKAYTSMKSTIIKIIENALKGL